MPELPLQGIDAPAPTAVRLPIADAPAGGASRGGGVADDAARQKRLRALAAEIETLPTTHAAFARLLSVAVESLHGAGAWIGLTMEDTDALVVVASHGDVPVATRSSHAYRCVRLPRRCWWILNMRWASSP
jgi:hypothetical protein